MMMPRLERLCTIIFSLSLFPACNKTEETSEVLQQKFIKSSSELKTCVSYLGIEQFLADKSACKSEWTHGDAVAGDQVGYVGYVTVNGAKNFKFVYIGKYDQLKAGATYSCTLNANQISKLRQQDFRYSVLKANNRRFFENTVRCGQNNISDVEESQNTPPVMEGECSGNECDALGM